MEESAPPGAASRSRTAAPAYNGRMHASLAILHKVRSGALVLGLASLSALAVAQSGTPTAAAPPEPLVAEQPARNVDEKIERIQHEDAGSRIDELRVGGQTRSITVQPKNGAPAYEVAPARGGEDLSTGSSANTGRSRWRLLNF